MLKYLKSKLNEHPEKMVSRQRRALTDVPSKEANYSLVDPIEEENESTSTPSATEVDTKSSPIPVSSITSNRHSHWL